MPASTPVPPLPRVTVPLTAFIPPMRRHYFCGAYTGPYTRRRVDVPGMADMLPLVRSFLDTCAAERDRDYRYLFTLLGSELATNALVHSRSGRPEATYTLIVERGRGGLTLTCRDDGDKRLPPRVMAPERAYLRPSGLTSASSGEAGRGLALVDALSTTWGDNGWATHRNVWFHLSFDMEGSAWPR
ncbi:ATP-binding protein [Nocardiopsis chromatogenes]|uniref:ATP-binding protein n=1 Tax=Nocardiopsis chromatogenes TaxID=280239 RepID=UPI000348369A|nr:ATP-binding protein [Nocardiopsis chromatogenes]